MMGLEFCTKKAIKGRKTHKAELTISDLDNDIAIARKQFELEQARSGQRDISELNDKIASLNTQINTINAQHKEQIKNYEQLLNANEESKGTIIENQRILIEDYKRELNSILKQISESFSNEERIFFVDFCNHFVYKKNSSYKPNNPLNQTFKDDLITRNLIIFNENDFKFLITPLGETLYAYINKNYPLF